MRHFISRKSPSLVLAAWLFASVAAADSTKGELRSTRAAGSVDQVVSVLEVSGEVIPRGAAKKDKAGEPLSVNCKRDYSEKTLEVPAGGEGRWRAVRQYSQATATLAESSSKESLDLRPEHRLLAAQVAAGKSTLFSPRGPLTMDELELVSALGNSLPLDAFLPVGEVAVGDTWKNPDSVLAALLDLDEITRNETQSILKELTPEIARIEISGPVRGTHYDAAAEVDLKAKCRFDRKTGRIDWFALLVTENREVGLVEHGIKVTARLQMKIAPAATAEGLQDADLKGLSLEPTAALCSVLYRSPDTLCQLTHDRRWMLASHQRGLDIFHLMEREVHVAMCKFSPMPKAEAGKLIPLTQFQSDIQTALGKNFGEFVEAAEFTNPRGYRVYRVLVRGEDAKMATAWHYYLVTSPEGCQAAFAFRLDEKQQDRFGKSAEKFVDSLEFVSDKAK